MRMIKALTRLLVAGVAAAHLHAAAPASAEEIAVKIGNFTTTNFKLSRATSRARWLPPACPSHWGWSACHTVVSQNNFRSKVLDTDGKYSFAFTTPGTYKYFCSLHPHMTGTVIVEATTGILASPE